MHLALHNLADLSAIWVRSPEGAKEKVVAVVRQEATEREGEARNASSTLRTSRAKVIVGSLPIPSTASLP